MAAVLTAPLPPRSTDLPTVEPAVSVVVVTHNNLVFTRLCLESLLLNTAPADVESSSSTTASSDMTPAYLPGWPRTTPGFTCSQRRELGLCLRRNQGLRDARGDVLVLLNNDTMVPPGWVDRLERHLLARRRRDGRPGHQHAPNEARIDVPYSTYRDFVHFAAERARREDGCSFEISA